uniref:Phosphorylase b kinase regulatory subunit n=1 Tax=Plectus sambesii TaxID=2011161 RepID=A0A914XRT9_9BILA
MMTPKKSRADLRSSTKLRRLTQAYLTPLTKKHSVKRDTTHRVDSVYESVRSLLLDHQSVTTGLFPRFSKDKTEGYVRDSIYCALACWATSIAYQRLDDDRGRQTELRQTAIKTMRGILFCWMLQADRLEQFKQRNTVELSLHSKFDFATGMPIATTDEYNHLQMDIVALFLIALVEMTSGGAQIIYTQHEVSFIQNLVFYIERTYRTPDFGMWEKGTRYNVGSPEIHASSLGMVKAALESINGFNVCGSAGTSASVIFVDIDGHNRNRTTFETILPRESDSKNTDAALLPTIGWPCFATHDPILYDRSFKKLMRRLEGKYGVKRFLRDGYRTELEDMDKRFYGEHDTFQFDSIECQWPMFFGYIALTAHLKGDMKMADEYFGKMCDVMVPTVDSTLVVPECYFVPEDCVDDEKKEPGSQSRYPVNPLETGHFLWAQAIYIITLLLRQNLVHSSELDPIYRHLPASQRPKVHNRHSAFRGSMEGEPVVQVALIAESTRLQMMLSTYGISTQTPHEVEPVQIWPSWRMVKVFESLGKSKKMQLTGRPNRPFGALNTSKIFRVFGDTVLCYPLLFEVSDFYVTADPAVLIEDIKRDIAFVAKRWKLAGRPTFCVILREDNVVGEHFDQMLELLVNLKNGFVDGVRVRVGRVHQLLGAGCTEHVDFAEHDEINFDREPFEEVDSSTGGPSVLGAKMDECYIEMDADVKEKDVSGKTDYDLNLLIKESSPSRLRTQAFAVCELWTRFNGDYKVDNDTLSVRLERIYRQAAAWKLWWLVRYCAAKLRKTIDSLAPGITTILARGKRVTLGVRSRREVTIRKPMAPKEIVDILFSSCPETEPQTAVLQQELLIACADLITQRPKCFDGVLTIRLGWLTDAVNLMLNYGVTMSRKKTISPPVAAAARTLTVYDLAPTVVKDMVTALFCRENWHMLSSLQTRRLNGALNRVPTDFYDRVWKILERTKDGIVIANNFLPQQPTLSDMTQFELTFAFRVESMMSEIGHPEYRQLLVELCVIVSTILERNPELGFGIKVDMDSLIQRAFSIFADERKLADREEMTLFYQLDENERDGTTATYLARAIIDTLLKGENIRKAEINYERRKSIDNNDICSIS